MDIKPISHESVSRALALAERYRLLNEPEQAASICQDILEVEPEHHDALRQLLLALTEQFSSRGGASNREAEAVVDRLTDPYEQTYLRGVVCERWGRAKLHQGVPPSIAGEWILRAMEQYQKAESLRPEGDDSALLRWNTCVRFIRRHPELAAESAAHEMHFGD